MLFLIVSVEAYGLSALNAALQPWVTIPLWIGWLLVLIAAIATAAAAFFQRFRQYHKLITLRRCCTRRLECTYAAVIENTVRRQIRNLLSSLTDDLETAEQQLQNLCVTIDDTKTELATTQCAVINHVSLFRQSAVDQTFVERTYHRWHRSPDNLRDPLLKDKKLLTRWRTLEIGGLKDDLLEYGRQVFAQMQTMTLQETFRQKRSEEIGEFWSLLEDGASPLLRPNFDRLGGGGYAYITHHLLTESIQTFRPTPLWTNRLNDWEIVVTSKPYVLISTSVRQLLPLVALHNMAYLDCKQSGNSSIHI